MRLKTWMFAVIGLCLGFQVAAHNDSAWQVQQALDTNRALMVLATDDACRVCDTMADTMDELAPWVSDKAQLSTLNIEHYPSLAEQLGIAEVATLYMIQDGQIIDSIALSRIEGHEAVWIGSHLLDCQKRTTSWLTGCEAHTYEVFMDEYTDESLDELFANILAFAAQYEAFELTIEGGPKEGTFSMKVPLFGKMEGRFSVIMPSDRDDADPTVDQGGLLTLQVTKKPFMLSCDVINNMVDDNIGSIGDALNVTIVRYNP